MSSYIRIQDASRNIVDMAVHRNTRNFVRTTNKNIDLAMIGLNRCFSIHHPALIYIYIMKERKEINIKLNFQNKLVLLLFHIDRTILIPFLWCHTPVSIVPNEKKYATKVLFYPFLL